MRIKNQTAQREGGAERVRVAGTVFLLLLCALPVVAASTDNALDASIDKFSGTWGNEFLTLCRTQNIPCGKEELRCNETKSETVSTALLMKNTSRRKVLDEIENRHPGSHWVSEGDVLNLAPEKPAGPDLLGKKLDRVVIHGSSSLKAALDVFQQANIPVNLSSHGHPPLYGQIELELRDVTVREALNAIAKADGQVAWSFCSDSPEKGTGSFNMSSWRTTGISPHDKDGKLR